MSLREGKEQNNNLEYVKLVAMLKVNPPGKFFFFLAEKHFFSPG